MAAGISSAVEDLARQVERSGALVEEATLPELDFGQEISSAGALIGMMVGAFQADGQEQPTTLANYLEALHRRDQSIVAWERFFEDWDALLCPASMVTAFPHCKPGTPLKVDGEKVDYRLVSAHGTVFNYTGHPAVVVPFKLDGEGLPIGVQLVGKRWDDGRLLAIAKVLSPMTGGFRRPPNY